MSSAKMAAILSRGGRWVNEPELGSFYNEYIIYFSSPLNMSLPELDQNWTNAMSIGPILV